MRPALAYMPVKLHDYGAIAAGTAVSPEPTFRGEASAFTSVMGLCNSILGAGLLSLPWAFAQAGHARPGLFRQLAQVSVWLAVADETGFTPRRVAQPVADRRAEARDRVVRAARHLRGVRGEAWHELSVELT